MKLFIGKEAGFCWGVKRALNLTEKAINANSDVYTYGPLIHNPQVVNSLTKKGVKITNDPTSISSGTLVIRAHGITPHKLDEIKNSTRLNIVDGTCPHVTKSEKKVAEFAMKNYHIIIVGDPKHAEVISLQGFAIANSKNTHAHNCDIVTSLDDVKKLNLTINKVFIIAQSTYNIDIFYAVINYFKNNTNLETAYFDSICSEPLKTQQELKEMCEIVECVIVIGGKISANTKRLEEIVSKYSKPCFKVETADELEIEKLSNFEKIGLTAGASTPDWIIDDIVNKIKNRFPNIEISLFESSSKT